MLEKAQELLADSAVPVELHQGSATEFKAESGHYAVVFSNLVIHNIPFDQKQGLLDRVNDWLEPEGTFLWSDLVRPTDDAEFERHLSDREEHAIAHGATKAFADANFEKERNEDFMLTEAGMIESLKSAGFSQVRKIWHKHNVLLLEAKK